MSRFETANRYEEFANTGQAAERGLAEPLAPWQSMTATNKPAPPVWSQGLFSDCCTGECSVVVCPSSHRSFVLTVHGAGVAYQCMPCCCGTPAAVRKVSGHLSKYGAHPTCNACCPCCHECQPRHTSEFGKSESVKGEIATGSWCCYCMFPPCYTRSNRELFQMQHDLPGA
jgi:hypothetical protein